jgi:DNA-binding NarL/FixJ family response regulator
MREVLIIDDDDIARSSIETWIKRSIDGTAVTPCKTIETALAELTKRRTVDVIVLDLFFFKSFEEPIERVPEVAQGYEILRDYPETSTILISRHPRQTQFSTVHPLSPLMQLSKPGNFSPTAQYPEQVQAVDEFQLRLIEAVNVALLVSTYERERKEVIDAKDVVIAKLQKELGGLRKSSDPIFGAKSIRVILGLVSIVVTGYIAIHLRDTVWGDFMRTILVTAIVLYCDRFLLLRDIGEMLSKVRNEMRDLLVSRDSH